MASFLAGALACDDGGIVPPADAGRDAPVDAARDVDAREPKHPGDACTVASECDDGVFCDGPEDCFDGHCIGARSTMCRDFGGCASARCDEASSSCVVDLPVDACPSGARCAPDVGCVTNEGCTDDGVCDDGRACTDDRCVTVGASKGCVHVPIDARCAIVGACGAPSCIGELAADPSGCTAKRDSARCAADQGCDRDFRCAALPSSCAVDDDCGDGDGCDGRERCEAGRCVHGAVATCAARDACHHALCRDRTVGEPYCIETQSSPCP